MTRLLKVETQGLNLDKGGKSINILIIRYNYLQLEIANVKFYFLERLYKRV